MMGGTVGEREALTWDSAIDLILLRFQRGNCRLQALDRLSSSIE